MVAAFLVLTIAGERLELTRMLPTPAHARTIFVAIVTTLTLAAVALAARPLAGRRPARARPLAAALRHCPPQSQ